MYPKDADGMANNVDPDCLEQSDLFYNVQGSVYSAFIMFA